MATVVRTTKFAHQMRPGDKFECMGHSGNVALIMQRAGVSLTIWTDDGRVLTVPRLAAARIEQTKVGVTL
jgi:hypothetical protein